MSVLRSTGTFQSGVTIANNVVSTSSEADLLGNNTSSGKINLYITFTSTAVIGSVDVSLYGSDPSGTPFPNDDPLIASIVPVVGTLSVQSTAPWQQFPVPRFVTCSVLNNATGADLTAVTVSYELFQVQ